MNRWIFREFLPFPNRQSTFLTCLFCSFDEFVSKNIIFNALCLGNKTLWFIFLNRTAMENTFWGWEYRDNQAREILRSSRIASRRCVSDALTCFFYCTLPFDIPNILKICWSNTRIEHCSTKLGHTNSQLNRTTLAANLTWYQKTEPMWSKSVKCYQDWISWKQRMNAVKKVNLLTWVIWTYERIVYCMTLIWAYRTLEAAMESAWYLASNRRSSLHSNSKVGAAVWLQNMAVKSRCTKKLAMWTPLSLRYR